MAASSSYRERVPVPTWVVPAASALGGLWVARRVRGQVKRGRPRWRIVFTVVNSALSLSSALGLLRRFGNIAVEVDDEYIHAGAGPAEQRIPVANVRDVRVARYNPLRFLGWGYRLGLGGNRAISQIGVQRGVEITSDEDGRQRRYFISSNSPEELAAAIAGVAGLGVA
jgi:hypothetical protein